MSDFSGDSGFPTPPPPPPSMTPPPGYVAYGGGNVGAYGNFQRIGGLAKALRILIIILIPVLAISALLFVSVRGKAQDFVDGNADAADFTDAAGPYAAFSLISSPLTLAVAVLTIIWMFRMAKNQIELRRAGTWGPPWAIAGWFLPPCILYVIPYLMMRDLWKASDPNSAENWKQNPVGLIVHVWWVLFGLLPIAFIGATLGNFRFDPNASDREAAQNILDNASLTLLAVVVQVAAAVAYLLLVSQLSARHKQVTNES